MVEQRKDAPLCPVWFWIHRINGHVKELLFATLGFKVLCSLDSEPGKILQERCRH